MVTMQVGVFPVVGRAGLWRLDAQQPVILGADYPALSRLLRSVFLVVFTVTRRLEHTTWGYRHRASLMNGSCVPLKPWVVWSEPRHP